MANILFLVHRLPYPPNKGDKVRSFHLLKHLAARHRVYLGTFIDDPDDEQHVETVRALCAELYTCRLRPSAAKLRSLAGLIDGRPLSLAYYEDRSMNAWVKQTATDRSIDATVVFSSVMGQFVAEDERKACGPMLVDFVDVDSAKWSQYAAQHRWPMSWVYAREGRRLLAYERALAARAQRSFFVTEAEVSMFKRLAPQSAGAVEAIGNGVDADFFSPDAARSSPFARGEVPVVFTGAMDYWPNVDAVTWFAESVLPALRLTAPKLRFYIVGRSPTAAVSALACDAVTVTGTVPDVRPYLQHAAVIVAPMRIARGVQNKILEAMAMAKPVVAARECVAAIDAVHGQEMMSAGTADEYVRAIRRLLDDSGVAADMGNAGRACVVKRYTWDAHLARFDRYIPARGERQATAKSRCANAMA